MKLAHVHTHLKIKSSHCEANEICPCSDARLSRERTSDTDVMGTKSLELQVCKLNTYCTCGMATYDSDSSGGEDDDYTETNVLLGYASREPTADTISQLGGHPVRLAQSYTHTKIVLRDGL